ncbi:MAG: tetratricopeptide repeat protein [Candidatus Nitrosopolaris sp.]
MHIQICLLSNLYQILVHYFIYLYTNGTSLYESNRGGVFSYNGLPKDKDALYEKGNNLFKLGNYTGSILYYDKTLVIDSKDVRALTEKGVSLFKLGNYTGAIEYYDRALAIDPKHENALYNKGVILYQLGNYTEAIGYFDKALAIDPKDEVALYEKGVVLDKLGKDLLNLVLVVGLDQSYRVLKDPLP